MLDESKSSLLLFNIVSTTFIPGKEVSKLRSFAELRAFYGINQKNVDFVFWLLKTDKICHERVNICKARNSDKFLQNLFACHSVFMKMEIYIHFCER